MLRAAADLRRSIRKWRPTVVHAHGLRAFTVALLSLTGRPYITLHGTGSTPVDPRGWRILRWIAVAMMPVFSRRAMAASPMSWPLWHHVPHASPSLAGLHVLPFPDGDTPTFLWVGALDHRKQPDLFIEALRIAGGSVDVRGIVAGSGPRLDEIAQLVAESRVRVELVGHVADVAPLLARSWAVVLLSLHEGVPFALEEAMWAGRVVIASPHPGTEWLAGPTARYATSAAVAAAAMVQLSDREVALCGGERAAARVRQVLQVTDPWPRLERLFSARSDARSR
jgi:glycosyltransferase involved in cell wall biosynthesis